MEQSHTLVAVDSTCRPLVLGRQTHPSCGSHIAQNGMHIAAWSFVGNTCLLGVLARRLQLLAVLAWEMEMIETLVLTANGGLSIDISINLAHFLCPR